MATKKAATAKRTTVSGKASGFSAEEKAAMRERVKELKAAEGKADMEREVLEKIRSMPASDRALGLRIHAIVKANAPGITSRLWYGMPSYAKNDKIVCHFQDANKFKMRYATLAFTDEAKLDEGTMWPNAFALTSKLTAADEARIVALVKKAVS